MTGQLRQVREQAVERLAAYLLTHDYSDNVPSDAPRVLEAAMRDHRVELDIARRFPDSALSTEGEVVTRLDQAKAFVDGLFRELGLVAVDPALVEQVATIERAVAAQGGSLGRDEAALNDAKLAIADAVLVQLRQND